jgi:hypothetical protein
MRKIFIITNHALARYRERHGAVGSDQELRDEISGLLRVLKPRDRRAMRNKAKNTAIAKTPNGFFIASNGKVVSFVKELREHGDGNDVHTDAAVLSPGG